jgi:hypothetical protein
MKKKGCSSCKNAIGNSTLTKDLRPYLIGLGLAITLVVAYKIAKEK